MDVLGDTVYRLLLYTDNVFCFWFMFSIFVWSVKPIPGKSWTSCSMHGVCSYRNFWFRSSAAESTSILTKGSEIFWVTA